MGLRRGGATEPRTRRTLGCHARAGAAVGAARPGPEQQCVHPPHGRPSALGRLGTRGRGDSSELRQATGRSPVRSTLKRKPARTGTVTAPQCPRLDPRPCARAAFHGEAGSAPKMALRALGRGPGARSMAQRPPRKTRRELGEGSEGLTGLGAVCRCAQACTSDVRRSSWPSGCTEQPWERKQARRRAAGQRRAAGARSPRGVRAPAGPPRICARACVRVMRCWRPRMDQEGRGSGRSLRTRRPALGRPGRLCQRTARAPAARPPVGRDRCPSAHGVLPPRRARGATAAPGQAAVCRGTDVQGRSGHRRARRRPPMASEDTDNGHGDP